MKTNGNLISFSFTTSFDEEKVKIRNDGWCNQEKEEALKHNINLEDYKLIKVTHGLCERGKVSKGLLAAFDGYEIIITLKTNPKFKTGDKVKIINYGSLIHISKEGYDEQRAIAIQLEKKFEHMLMFKGEKEFPIEIIKNSKPENIITEIDKYWIIDVSPELVGKEGIIKGSYTDLYPTITPEEDSKIYSINGIKGKSSWYDEDQLELII